MIKPTEKFNFNEPTLNTTKLGLGRLSVYNSRRNNQFSYAGTVLDGDDDGSPIRESALLISEPISSNTNTGTNTNTIASPMIELLISRISLDSNITSVLNYKYIRYPNVIFNYYTGCI